MSQDEPFSLSEWVRARPWAVVAFVSVLVLVLGSAVALSRGGTTDDDTEVLAQPTAAPSSDPLPLTSTSASPAAVVSPSASATPTPSTTATPSVTVAPSATVTPTAVGTQATTTTEPRPAATTRPASAGPTRAPSPTPTTTTPTTTTRPPTTTPSPAGRATVTVENRSGEAITFQINAASRFLLDGQSVTVPFTLRANGADSATVGTLPPRECTQSRSGLGVEPGGTYSITVTSVAKACGSEAGPRLPSGPW